MDILRTAWVVHVVVSSMKCTLEVGGVSDQCRHKAAALCPVCPWKTEHVGVSPQGARWRHPEHRHLHSLGRRIGLIASEEESFAVLKESLGNEIPTRTEPARRETAPATDALKGPLPRLEGAPRSAIANQVSRSTTMSRSSSCKPPPRKRPDPRPPASRGQATGRGHAACSSPSCHFKDPLSTEVAGRSPSLQVPSSCSSAGSAWTPVSLARRMAC